MTTLCLADWVKSQDDRDREYLARSKFASLAYAPTKRIARLVSSALLPTPASKAIPKATLPLYPAYQESPT
ncbi:hypothetical protein [Pseudomarimonas arenosa]|uniref:Uncharacterized protein n=1 Tax=Pseudomarimonas arenosa TaxID=2774145 RepID=A0AAW3ZSC5_9GAMM|nr:hypothetical protein [Pseudomarimonas arenosa]MBD8527444.1 hypothetical protein [Pseudomarimonas arenosa]